MHFWTKFFLTIFRPQLSSDAPDTEVVQGRPVFCFPKKHNIAKDFSIDDLPCKYDNLGASIMYNWNTGMTVIFHSKSAISSFNSHLQHQQCLHYISDQVAIWGYVNWKKCFLSKTRIFLSDSKLLNDNVYIKSYITFESLYDNVSSKQIVTKRMSVLGTSKPVWWEVWLHIAA